MTAERRDAKIARLMEELVASAKSGDHEIDDELASMISTVASSSVRSFRELVLIICIGRLLDPTYDPTSALYKCNPRAIYEGPIRHILRRERIPHGKSGALNVAKAAEGLNPAWAKQRRGGPAASVVVTLAEIVADAEEELARSIAIGVLAEMLDEAQRIDTLVVQAREETRPAEQLISKLTKIIHLAPDGGNTAQRVVGYVLAASRQSLQAGVRVVGHEDRASTTNVTSGKPGDLMEVLIDERRPVSVIEVTTKMFDLNRVEDSVDAVQTYQARKYVAIDHITVLCRNEDVPAEATRDKQSRTYLGHLELEGTRLEFIDIFEWLAVMIAWMPDAARASAYQDFSDYVSEPNTAASVKAAWLKLHEGSSR